MMYHHIAHNPTDFHQDLVMYANLVPKSLAGKLLFVVIGLPIVVENKNCYAQQQAISERCIFP